jgi:hypothetical protein
MPTPMPLPSYRLARREDIPALITLFEQLAPEMPLHGVPRDEIHKWATPGYSSVALLGPSRELVGVVLGDLRRHGSPLVPGGEPQPHGIALFYAGVAPEPRGQGIFSMMISVLQRCGRPLFGDVHARNKSRSGTGCCASVSSISAAPPRLSPSRRIAGYRASTVPSPDNAARCHPLPQGERGFQCRCTYSYSTGMLLMPRSGGAIQLAILPGAVTRCIRLLTKARSFSDGIQPSNFA